MTYNTTIVIESDTNKNWKEVKIMKFELRCAYEDLINFKVERFDSMEAIRAKYPSIEIVDTEINGDIMTVWWN